MGQSTPHRTEADSQQAGNTVSVDDGRPKRGGPSSTYFSLDDDEELLWEARESPKELIPGLLVSLLFLIGGGAILSIASFQILGAVPSNAQLPLLILGAVICVVGIGIAGYTYWSHRKKCYAVTTKATYRKWGEYVSAISMDDIAAVDVGSRSPLDRVFSSGDLVIHWEKDEARSTTYSSVPDPTSVREWITENLQVSHEYPRF